MTFHPTIMSALKLFETRSTARRLRLATFDWWVKFGNVTRAVDWLYTYPLARLAVS